MVVILCVCMSVCACLLYVENIEVPLSFLWCSQDMYCVNFAEIALFKSYGDICWSPLPSSLLDELLVNKRPSDGFFSRKPHVVDTYSKRSYNSTESSLKWLSTVKCSASNLLCWFSVWIVPFFNILLNCLIFHISNFISNHAQNSVKFYCKVGGYEKCQLVKTSWLLHAY